MSFPCSLNPCLIVFRTSSMLCEQGEQSLSLFFFAVAVMPRAKARGVDVQGPCQSNPQIKPFRYQDSGMASAIG